MKRINKFYVWLLLIALPCAGAAGQVKVDTTSQVNVDSASPDRSYFSVGRALNEFYSRVITRKAATVGFLGGSITYNPGWRDKVCAWLQGRFPETKFRFIAAGISLLGSLSHAFRVQRDLLDSGRVDLLFLETAVYDRVNGTDSLSPARALGGGVRHVKKGYSDGHVIINGLFD